ncbi:hypothetical protein LH29_10610 [Draconibacterium sediminis]|uniref:Glycosyl hydrolase family 98 putative carbohydrate-binding module domain-containing protein n=2 Tax=Draconibacterium sediminis TaxID=1544798 RepID=A0A0D8JCM8_9BACT|nr:hypothetical protein LH29_10610 [Draconibacterium sediminis]
MTLGNVETSVAQGIFDPVKDEVQLNDGTVISNYYKESLGIKYYQPVDKSNFPLPPSGWCSWYYYYQEITGDEFLKNADWIAENLKDYGAQYVQLDDGWQGVGHGSGNNRDWTTINERFSMGMDTIASYIKSLGLKPGIWLAPHGQSNPEVVKSHPGAFLEKPDGTSASDTWEGKFLVDPSSDAGQNYIESLFTTLTNWGYEYIKIDGQPIVTREYRNKKEFMQNPSDDSAELYRETIKTMRNVMGTDKYLLGCWVVPLEGVGIMNGSRTGGDDLLSWNGFRTALNATMQYYFLHNIAWYTDPDVMLVRSPLPLRQARVWAAMQGLTGEALMCSDRMMDLSAERVDIVRKVFPATDIRPLDLFPAGKEKPIWDLKVSHLGRSYDVVGLFNFGEEKEKQITVNWAKLGIPENKPVHVFDFWNRDYLGAWENGISVGLQPTSCKVFALVPDNGQVQLVSTSRHITQGWVDLKALKRRDNTFSGTSQVIKNDPYELYFAFPKGKNFKITGVTANNEDRKLETVAYNHDGWACLRILSSQTGNVDWKVSFEETELFQMPQEKVSQLWLEPTGINTVNVHWVPKMQTTIGYKVYLDGKEMGYTPDCSFSIAELDLHRKYQVEVQTVWYDGTGSGERATIEFVPAELVKKELFLNDLSPVRTKLGWRVHQTNRSVSGNGLVLDGELYHQGIGLPTNSELEYRLDKGFTTFEALVGIDDANGKEGNVEFVLIGDGRELWKSGWVKKSDPGQKVSVDIRQVKRLTLRVNRGEGGNTGDQSEWVNAKLIR